MLRRCCVLTRPPGCYGSRPAARSRGAARCHIPRSPRCDRQRRNGPDVGALSSATHPDGRIPMPADGPPNRQEARASPARDDLPQPAGSVGRGRGCRGDPHHFAAGVDREAAGVTAVRAGGAGEIEGRAGRRPPYSGHRRVARAQRLPQVLEVLRRHGRPYAAGDGRLRTHGPFERGQARGKLMSRQ